MAHILSFFLPLRKHKKRISVLILLSACILVSQILHKEPFQLPLRFPTFRLGHTQENAFHELTDSIFQTELTQNTLAMHYTIAAPSDFGIEDYTPVLPTFFNTSEDGQNLQADRWLQALYRIDRQKLAPEEYYDYSLLEHALALSVKGSDFTLWSNPLSPHSGMQTNLPLLLSEYVFRDERDVEDYLALLAQTGTYLDALADYEAAKIQKGLGPSLETLQKTRMQCEGILSMEDLEQHTHFLQTGFDRRLSELSERLALSEQMLSEHKLSEHKLSAYRAENDRLLKTVLFPAYDALVDRLLLLEDTCPSEPPRGLCSLKGGKEYYEYLFSAETGSSLTLPQAKEALLQTLDETKESLQNISASETKIGSDCDPLPKDPSQIIACLQSYMTDIFPPFPGESGYQADLCIKKVEAEMENSSAPAFYLTSPADDSDINVIYINPKTTTSALELFTTLAHEGYPGHLYQNVYFNKLYMQNDMDKSRLILGYGGYTEGWAVYTEFMAYDFAYDYLTQKGEAQRAKRAALEKESRKLLLCLYTLADIMIHHENATLYQITELFLPMGIEDSETISSIYTYIAENPCNYPKYFVGYLEIMALKKQAAKYWDSQYSELAFHTFYLESGPSDFASLQERLKTLQLP